MWRILNGQTHAYFSKCRHKGAECEIDETPTHFEWCSFEDAAEFTTKASAEQIVRVLKRTYNLPVEITQVHIKRTPGVVITEAFNWELFDRYSPEVDHELSSALYQPQGSINTFQDRFKAGDGVKVAAATILKQALDKLAAEGYHPTI